MDLNKTAAKIRPRNHWQAIDLGFQMVQRWWKPLYFQWLIITFPFFLLSQIVSIQWSWLGILIFWWLKPLWERVPLYFLSHALFGEFPTWRETLRATPRLFTIQWFPSLTWRRFSVTRSFDLPIIQLEGLSGEQRKQRMSDLHFTTASHSFWLTTFGYHFEYAICFGVLTLGFLFAPMDWDIEWESLIFADSSFMLVLNNFIYYCAMSAVAPFYVAAGFCLYLNRRTILEGWDIELTFRNLANRLEQTNKQQTSIPSNAKPLNQTSAITVLTPFLSFITVLVFVGFHNNPALATENDPNTYQSDTTLSSQQINRERSNDLITKVMAGDEFHNKTKHSTLKKIGEEEEAEKEEESAFWSAIVELLKQLFKGQERSANIALVLEVLLWCLGGLLIIFIVLNIIRLRHFISLDTSQAATKKEAPKTLFGMEIQPETLPDSPLEEAERLLREGEIRAAVSLLLRTTIMRLIQQHDLDINESDTESECLHKIAQLQKERITHYCKELTQHWLKLAYAHQNPSHDHIQALINGWPTVFEDKAVQPDHSDSSPGGMR